MNEAEAKHIEAGPRVEKDLRPDEGESSSADGHRLRRRLGVRDLVLAQVLYVVGGNWVGVAAGLGRGQALTWLAAMALFFFPMAAMVVCVNRVLPLEGGLYVWARRAFGGLLGFMVAWNLLLYGFMNVAVILSEVPSGIAYLVGPSASWLPENRLASLAIVAAILGGITLAAARGLGVGKWIQNLGGVAVVVLYALLIGLPVWVVAHHRAIDRSGFELAMPVVNLHTLAIFGQMLFGALCGLEYVAILAGESRQPSRSIGRSVWIASPIICAMFLLGTASVVAFTGGHGVDLIAPVPQVLRVALGGSGVGSWLAGAAIFLLQLRLLGASSFTFTAVTRLPLAVGWDHLVPKWFTQLDAKTRLPQNSIHAASGLVFLVVLLSRIGVHAQEAFQVLSNASVAHYALAYMAMFAIPLWGDAGLRAMLPRWLRYAAAMGMLATVFSLFISSYPIVDVTNPGAYALKVLGTTAVSNCVGLAVFRSRQRWAGDPVPHAGR